VPVEVRPDRRRALAIRWLINAARKRGENTMTEKLAAELLDASTTAAPRSRSAKTPTRWPKPTGPSRTTAGKPSKRRLPGLALNYPARAVSS
jgi:hypothetical protein